MPIPTDELRQLIAQGKLDEAVTKLLEYTPQLSESFREEVYSLSSRWQRLQQKIRQGLLTDDEQNVEISKIEKACLGLLSAWEKGDEQLPVVVSSSATRLPWKRYAAIAVTLIAVLVGIADFTGLNLRDLIREKEPTTTDPIDSVQKRDSIPVSTLPPADSGEELPTADPPAQVSTRSPEDQPRTNAASLEGGRPDSSTLPASPEKLQLQTQTNKGPGPAVFTSAETMRVYYKVNRPCLLRVIYKLADGRLVLFENDREVTEAQVGKFVELGDGYEAAAPFGEEQMYFFVQSEPFPALVTQMTGDGYPEITEGLQESLRKTRGFKKKVYQVESVLSITTQE